LATAQLATAQLPSAQLAPGQLAAVEPEPEAVETTAMLRSRLRLTQPEFARLVPVSVRLLASLEKGAAPSDVVARRLVELRRLVDALTEVIRVDALGSWLKTPNSAFAGLKPIEVVERGESDRLWSMIFFLRSGVAS
jgi:DNA-binding transcriptional regulator YiaG